MFIYLGATKTAIIVTCEHAFCDGQSLTFLCHVLLKKLANQIDADDNKYSNKWGPAFEVASEGDEAQVAAQKQGLGSYPPPTKVAIFPEENKFEKNAFQLAATSTTRIQRLEFDEVQTKKLLEAARHRKTTLTGVIAAAIMHGCADIIAAQSRSVPTESTDEGSLNISIACGADTRKLYNKPIPAGLLGYHVSGVPMFAKRLMPNLTPSLASGSVGVAGTGGTSSEGSEGALAAVWETAADMRSHIQGSLAVRYPLATAPFVGARLEIVKCCHNHTLAGLEVCTYD